MLILVHTMGRVGSTSVYEALAARFPEATVRHIHALSPTTLASQVARSGAVAASPVSVQSGLAALADLAAYAGQVRIVTLVRDAMTRNLSAAFALACKGRSLDEIDALVNDAGAATDLWRSFFDRRPFEWFDRELLGPTGVDVFAHPFSRDGWTRIDGGRFDVLVMRSELDDHAKSALLGDCFGVEPIDVSIANADHRAPELVELYATFRQSIELDPDYLAEVAASKYQRHFYGDETNPVP